MRRALPAPRGHMTRAYRYDPKAARLPGLAGTGLVIATATTAVVQSGTIQIAFAVVAGLSAIGLTGVLPLLVDRRVQLSISPQGLTYRPFSTDPVPWEDITAVAIVRTTHRLGRLLAVLWKETLTRESINFDVLDPNRFARGQPFYRLSARLMNQGPVPTYPVEISFLHDADSATLSREIARFWKGPIEAFATPGRA